MLRIVYHAADILLTVAQLETFDCAKKQPFPSVAVVTRKKVHTAIIGAPYMNSTNFRYVLNITYQLSVLLKALERMWFLSGYRE